ncbi:MAG TPA: metal-dependent transcriptional regulator [Dehalococcoidales bacterium]|nr:metal-dependent transcriptional regulator [Dehalococcoidales bacterium]
MNNRTQEYLEALFTLTQNGQKASTTDVSNKIKVAPASVTEKLKKMAEEGYVIYEPYQGVRLTQRGFELAQKMTRKHRLMERFLWDVLQIKSEKVHDEACAMEHGLSDETERALCQTLKAPAKCPDDNQEIPACDLEFNNCAECKNWANENQGSVSKRKTSVVSVSSMKEKQEGTVAFIRGDDKSLKRLQDLGFIPGTRIKVVRMAPLKGPVEISLRGSKIALGEKVACNVFVENER